MIGNVRREVAESTGAPEGVPVVVSPADTQCGLLGLGVSRVGQVGTVAGWSIPLVMLTDTPVFDEERRTWTGCYVEDDLWSLESTCGDAGNSYRWLADTMWAGETGPFESMDAAASDVPAGSHGILSFLGPSRMDMSSVGIQTGGFIFPVPMTFSGIGRGHLTRAALESIAFAVRAKSRTAGVREQRSRVQNRSGRGYDSHIVVGGDAAERAWASG